MKTSIILSFASLAAAVCNHGTRLAARDGSGLVSRADGVFGYHELAGPLNWNSISEAAETCATGTNQSPINVIPSELTTIRGRTFLASIPTLSAGSELINLGTTVQVAAGGTVRVGRKVYTLAQFHFHTPSEHHLNSAHYPAEVHFVFQASDDALLVIGFFLEVASANTEVVSAPIETVLASVGAIPNSGDTTTTGALDFSTLVNHLHTNNVYRYDGSLTTPPCDEGVLFNVVEKPLFISPARYRALKKVVKFNSRFTQNKPGQVNLLQNAANVLN